MTIKEINELIEREYIQEKIQNVRDNWFPLMKYDEDYGVSKSLHDIQYLIVGLNPSLTNKFAKHIHETIFEIEDTFDPMSTHDYGRKEIYLKNKAAITKKLVDYQALLKYDSKERIPYFKQLENFFIEIENKTSFKENIFHYDFCQLRHTDSNGIKKIIEDNYEILTKHLDTIIELVQPKIIFIFNASLATLLKENNFFSSTNLDDELGCYFYNDIPVVLANQLSGGATSSVYREILIWNTKKILNKSLK
jgi:hypothetical protein